MPQYVLCRFFIIFLINVTVGHCAEGCDGDGIHPVSETASLAPVSLLGDFFLEFPPVGNSRLMPLEYEWAQRTNILVMSGTTLWAHKKRFNPRAEPIEFFWDRRGENLNGATFYGTNDFPNLFDLSSLVGSTFGEFTLKWDRFIGTNLRRSLFQGGSLEGVDFYRADLTQAKFQKVFFSACRFQEVNLTEASFQDVTISPNCLFSGCMSLGLETYLRGCGAIVDNSQHTPDALSDQLGLLELFSK